MTTIRTCENQTEWDELIVSYGGHPLQLWGWGETKAAYHWEAERLMIYEGETLIGLAQLLIRRLPAPFRSLVYVPRGPVAEEKEREAVLEALAEHAKQTYAALMITIEPDWKEMPELEGWRESANTILIPRTLVLDLSHSEETLLAAMSKKTRQYIRKSGNEPITIRQVKNREELAACLELYHHTAERAGFGIHDDRYYYDIYDNLGENSPVFAAFLDTQPVAFLWLAISREVAFELYGGMNDDGQRLRANYALKWHAIRTIKRWGIAKYDFNGLLNDGVSAFKQGFAAHETMLVGTYDKPLSPLYILWNTFLPLAKKAIRKLRKR